ncbi:MAG: hypothetical protein K2N43_00800, partial [Lachnospiraceae bacterium]|nr:hypothetical protein [Lachnospiraceae bacterium]
MGYQIILISCPDKFLDIVGEGGIVDLVDLSNINKNLDQGQLFFRERAVITNNSRNLLHGDA